VKKLKVTISDALEILKFLAGLPNVLTTGGKGSLAWSAGTIGAVGFRNPTIGDALEVLKYLAGLPNAIFEKL
jgi:hypothetical protein